MNTVCQADKSGETEEMMFQLGHLDALEDAIQSIPDLRLVVIDPVGSFIGGRTDAHRDNEVRAVLAPVAQLAERYDVAMLIVAHNRKGASTNADDTTMGSRAFVALARTVWHLIEDPDDKNRRLLLPGKNNLAASQPGLAFSIVGEPGAICWEQDPVNLHADDGMAAVAQHSRPGPEAEAASEALDFLRGVLADGPRLAKEIKEEAKEGHGISESTLKRSKKKLGVEVYRNDIPGPWWWRLPHTANKTATSSKGEELGHLDPLAKNKGKTPVLEHGEPKGAKLSALGPLGTDGLEIDDKWWEI
jgi:hypothetical protein